MHRTNWIVGILVLSGVALAAGQGVSVLELRGGYFNPPDIEGGLILGGSYGIAIDERVDLSLGVSYFNARNEDQTELAQNVVDNVVISTIKDSTRYSNTLLPITADVSIKMPIQPPLYLFFKGSIAYEFLFVKSTTFHGFGWMVHGGIEYTIGSRSSILLAVSYNSCKPRGNKEKQEGSLTYDQVNVSGLGITAGLKLEFY
jgi:hypothetical protein